MVYPGLTTFVMMLGVAVGTALFYYLNSDNPSTYGPYDGRSDNSGNYSHRPPPASRRGSPKLSKKKRQKCDECTICLCDLTTGFTKTLECKHIFHAKCINRWLDTSQTCPNCRESV